MRRNAHRRNEPEQPTDLTTATAAPLPPSAGPVDPVDGETVDQTTGEVEEATKEPTREEKMQGRLVELQAKVRELLDYDQIAEIRLALGAREGEIEKHIKKANDLGVREEDARRRLRIIRSSDTRFGLLRIFAPEETTEQQDIFYDPEQPNGRPVAEGDEAEAAALAAETGTATDGEWDQGAPDGTLEGAERVAAAAGVQR